MGDVPIEAEPVDVASPEALTQVATALGGVRELAVDVEADAMHHFNARLCFVQLGAGRDIFLVDTLAEGVQPRRLEAVFADAGVTKYFHAAQGDLQYLAEAGVRVHGLFDTHRAATLLGWPKVGLADLVHEYFGQTLKKEHQQADFSLRPLPPELREYIADDVRYLVEVGQRVREACVAADILEEVLLDCDRLCDEATARPDPADAVNVKVPKQGLSAAQVLVAQHLVRALHRLRLGWAEAADVPMGRMLSNRAIAAIAAGQPDTLKGLGRLEGVRGAFTRQHGEAVLSLLADLRRGAADGSLAPLVDAQPKDARRRKRETALLDWRKEAATARKVTPSVVLPNALVEALARVDPATLEALQAVPYFGEKRVRLYGPAVLGVLSALR